MKLFFEKQLLSPFAMGYVDVIEYKGYDIECLGDDSYNVFYCGDEIFFDTLEEAKEFIDEVSEEQYYNEPYVPNFVDNKKADLLAKAMNKWLSTRGITAKYDSKSNSFYVYGRNGLMQVMDDDRAEEIIRQNL